MSSHQHNQKQQSYGSRAASLQQSEEDGITAQKTGRGESDTGQIHFRENKMNAGERGGEEEVCRDLRGEAG